MFADVSFELAHAGFAVAPSCLNAPVAEVLDTVLSGDSTFKSADRILRRFKGLSVDNLSLVLDSVSAVMIFNIMAKNEVMWLLNDTILRLFMTQFNTKYDTSNSADKVKPVL